MGGGARPAVGVSADMPRGCVVRAATAADLDAIHAIETEAFSTPWSRTAFRDLLVSGSALLLVAARADGRVVGFAVVIVAADEAELANLAVARTARRMGVAARLLAEVLARAEAGGARQVFLEVRESNAGARALYAAYGFNEVGRRRSYYRSPDEDAVVLRRPAAPAMR